MLKKISLLITCLALTIASIALASHDAPSRWKGSNANLGLTLNTGDTDSKNINTGFTAQYTGDKWVNELTMSYQLAYSDGEMSKSIYNGTENLSYYLTADKKTFVAGNINAISDISSVYRYTLVSSLMYGRALISHPKFNVDIQVGPGLRYNAAHTGYQDEKRPVGVLLTNINWAISHWGTLGEKGRVEVGKPYNYYQSVTSLTNQVTGHLALQISFQVDHYSKLPKDTNHTARTNTTTIASLVYNF